MPSSNNPRPDRSRKRNLPLRSSKRSSYAAHVLGALAAFAGCANVVGLNEYQEVDAVEQGEGGNGGVGASDNGGAPDGGVPGGGGEAGSGTTGARGGDEGDGGEPATGGTSPTGGRSTTGGTPATGGTLATGGTPSGGTPATGGTDPGSTSCALPSIPAACADCIDTRCDSYCNDCLDDSDCVALNRCLQACTHEVCLDDCFNDHPSGSPIYLDVYGLCGFTTCSADCGAAYGEPCTDDLGCVSGHCFAQGGGFCTNSCVDDFDCPSGSWCAIDANGAQTCMIECGRDSDCAAYPGYICAYVTTYDDYAYPLCTFASSLSAPCDFDSECHSFYCTGTSGWCTDYCIADYSCPPDASCVVGSSGEARCLLTCRDQLDCDAYPPTSCEAGFDVDGAATNVCYL